VNIFGKANTPELGLMGITEPEAFGPTRNPWNTVDLYQTIQMYTKGSAYDTFDEDKIGTL